MRCRYYKLLGHHQWYQNFLFTFAESITIKMVCRDAPIKVSNQGIDSYTQTDRFMRALVKITDSSSDAKAPTAISENQRTTATIKDERWSETKLAKKVPSLSDHSTLV